MRKVLLFGILAALLVGTATFAVADGKRGDCPRKYCKMFEKKDTNSDGVISKAEFVAHAEKKFAKMDTDGNGSLTKEEIKSYRAAKREKYKEKKKDSGQCTGK